MIAPHVFVIMGATGDLTSRKLLPALYHLLRDEGLRDRCVVLGTGRGELDDAGFQALARASLVEHGLPEEEVARWTERRIHFQRVPDERAETFGLLADRIRELEEEYGLPGNRVFYLSVPPAAFPGAVRGLGSAGLARSAGWTRVVIEKPFGQDLETARALNGLVHEYFDEKQVYRIDHYLGKETVQNLLVFRFANVLFESVWNRDKIERVEILAAEQLGVEGRAGYYDRVGALRDMIQNHLTQLVTLLAMEVPTAYDAESIRFEKVKVLRAIKPIAPHQVHFGQYAAGRVDGRPVPGYREEPGIPPDSNTETLAVVELGIHNWRWEGVPFYVCAAKRLAERVTRIAVHFRCPPVALFESFESCVLRSNVLHMTIQPDEGFSLSFEVKQPGDPFRLKTEEFSFRYREALGPLPEAYQTLIGEVLKGDQTLFVHADEVEASWRLYTPVLGMDVPVHPYPAGSWGPTRIERQLEVLGRGNGVEQSGGVEERRSGRG